MAHLFGVIGLRGGVGPPMPLFKGTQSIESGDSSPVPLSLASVVAAIQTELRDRRGHSVVGLPFHRLLSVVAHVVCS